MMSFESGKCNGAQSARKPMQVLNQELQEQLMIMIV